MKRRARAVPGHDHTNFGMTVGPRGVRSQTAQRQARRRSNFRCAAIRSPLLRRAGPISNAIGYAKFRSRSHHAMIRVYDEVGNVIEAHEHAGRFQ
jgi:hypothetical protein